MDQPFLALPPTAQLVVLIVGGLVPLVGYVLNNKAPWVSETTKAIIQVALAAAAGAIYVAVGKPDFGLNNETLQGILSAVVAALWTHGYLYKPAKVNTKLGAVERTVVGE